MKVIDYKKVILSNIKYKEPAKTAGGCLLSRTFYKHIDQEIPIYIQTPRLRVNSDLEILDSKTYLELELDKKHINFYEFINNIDDQNIRETFKNSEDWFQEKLPMDVVDDYYKTNIKMRKYNKSPIIKFKIPIYKNNTKRSCDIFGDDLKPIEVNEIKQKTDVICILELEGIKFFKQRFETEWKVVQLRVYKSKEESLPCLINESFLSDNEDTENGDPFPEDGISLNSSITSDIGESDNFKSHKINNEEIVKNISIQVPIDNKNNKNSVNIEKVDENISLEITSPESGESSHEIDNITSNNKSHDNISKSVETKEENIVNADETQKDIKSIKTDSCVEQNTHSLDSNTKYKEDIDERNKKETLGENNEDYEDEDEFNNQEEENEEDEDEDEEDDEDEDDDNSMNEQPLDNYFSDNFTDEEEICDGLENNLQEINFVPQESIITNKSETIEKDNTSLNELRKQDKEDVKTDEEYENKSIQELISEISKFKQLASDRENEMTELKTKYRNLYSELNL